MRPTFRIKIRIQNNRLVRAREELGMTQAVASRAMGVDASTLSAFENLNANQPAWSDARARWTDTARKIADFYGFSPEYLWPEEIAALRKNAGQLEMSSREVCAFLDEERIEHRDFIAKVIPLMGSSAAGDLTHHLDETTLKENAPKYGHTPGGMYQRMQAANRKFIDAYRLLEQREAASAARVYAVKQKHVRVGGE
jgi:transcriptional regulator with XRE-family HTH domain